MKKQIFTLSTLAFLATSANAYTLLDNENSGTKLDLTGSARLVWKSTSHKATKANGDMEKEHINHAVADDRSRFGFKLTQQLGAGIYAVGNVEWRFRGTAKSQNNFDDIYAHQLNAGFGHKKYGELTYGNISTITDNVKQTDLPNSLSLSHSLLVGSSRRSAQYIYSGVEGLKVGGFFGGKSKRNSSGLTLKNQRKDVWGLAALYNYAIDDIQQVKMGIGVTRERSYNTGSHSTYARTAYGFGTAYTFENTTVGIDLERAITNHQGQAGNQRVQEDLRTIVKQKFTKEWAAYIMYAHKTNKLSTVTAQDSAERKNQYMVGTEYAVMPHFIKVRFKAFTEFSTSRAKKYTNGIKTSKTRDNVVAIGLRAYW